MFWGSLQLIRHLSHKNEVRQPKRALKIFAYNLLAIRALLTHAIWVCVTKQMHPALTKKKKTVSFDWSLQIKILLAISMY